jgi:hypothetical protein
MKKLFFGLFGATTLFFASCTKDEAVIDTTTGTVTESAVLLAPTSVVPILDLALKAALPSTVATQWEVAGQDFYAAKIVTNNTTAYAYFQASDAAFLMLKDANGITVRGGKKHTKGDIIALSTVPASAVAYVTTNYPGTTIKKAYTDTVGGITQYRLNIVDATTNVKTTLIFDATWTFVKAVTKTKGQGGQHTEVAIAIADVSTIATTYITANYAGYIIVSAEKATSSTGIVTYEVKISNGTTKYEIVFDAAWAFVKAKKH